MKKPIVVDYESYYGPDLNVSDIGVANYVNQSYAYMLAIKGADFEWVGTVEEAQKKFNDSFWEDHQCWAANAAFDEAWARRYWPSSRMDPWKCILDKGATSQYAQSVQGMVKGLFGGEVDKDVRDKMKGVHYHELPDDKKQLVLNYCLDDAREEWECLQALPEPSAVEDRLAAYTRMTNRRGLMINRELVEADRQALVEAHHDAKWSIPWMDPDELGYSPVSDAALSPNSLAEWCQFKRIPCPTTRDKRSAECDALMAQYPELAEVITNMRNVQGYNVLIKKMDSLIGRLDDNDIMPMELIFCGARHTRRWSSRGVNVQNLHANPIVLKSGREIRPRSWIMARPGKVFFIPDFSQIEPRCLAWLTGNWELIDLIEEGYGLYEAYARSVKIWNKREPLKESNPTLYKQVKAQVLGLGYGMGAARFQEQLDGVGLAEATQMVNEWRLNNPGIVQLWRRRDKQIMDTVRSQDKQLSIRMPTGDLLSHFMVRAARGGFESMTIRADRTPASLQKNLWGGVLVENQTQRMARDVMGEKLLALEDAGIPCLFSSHDEIIMEVDDTPETRKEVEHLATKIMTTAPEWAEDLPLAIEGGFHYHYTK